MEAIRSNMKLGTAITLVIERPPSGIDSEDDEGEGDQMQADPTTEPEALSVFDPRLFQ